MRIAVSVSEDRLFSHFGHSPAFALIDTDDKTHAIIKRQDVTAPPHEPGLLPRWLAERGVQLVLTGGIGPRALDLLGKRGIKVVSGAPEETPEALVSAYFAGTLATQPNKCHH